MTRVDLHRHLEGAIRVSTVVERCDELGIDVPPLEVLEPTPLLAALQRFDGFRLAVQGLDDVARIFREAVEDAEAEGLTGLELRFSPWTLARAAGASVDEVVRCLAALPPTVDLPVSLVVIVSRSRGLDAAWEVVRAVEDVPMAGADFASDEVRVPTRAFREVAEAFHARRLPLTVHTGEGTPASAIREALDLPGVRRLGHALSLIDAPELVDEVRARGIVVECCPTSNVRVGLATYADHPGRRLVEAGVDVALATDDPTLFGIDLPHELDVARSWGWTEEQVARSMQVANEARFR